jgi:hypothetical protein
LCRAGLERWLVPWRWRRPEAAREALADAIVQAQEALEELRALSRGIAPPVLTAHCPGRALYRPG